jgi:hypothetical protein
LLVFAASRLTKYRRVTLSTSGEDARQIEVTAPLPRVLAEDLAGQPAHLYLGGRVGGEGIQRDCGGCARASSTPCSAVLIPYGGSVVKGFA